MLSFNNARRLHAVRKGNMEERYIIENLKSANGFIFFDRYDTETKLTEKIKIDIDEYLASRDSRQLSAVPTINKCNRSRRLGLKENDSLDEFDTGESDITDTNF